MAVLGRIARVTGNLYRDLNTGRFLSALEVAPVLQQARAFGYLSATKSGGFQKAFTTLTELRGFTPDRANSLIADFRARLREWKEGGRIGDRPYLETPDPDE